jgi:uncharacterized protein
MNKETTMQRNDGPGSLGGEPPPLPWWRFRIVWFAIGLPAMVVIASLATAGIAWRHIDPLVDPLVIGAHPGRAALEPAERARNHAATPRH